MKIGILREGKTPPDKRVALTPNQCRSIMDQYPQVEIVVEKSEIRAIPDQAYSDQHIKIIDANELNTCDVLIGVKEVPIDHLIPNKTFFFFSHTIKEQPYNRDLLRRILAQNISLIDYETLVDERGIRMIGFGRYAGIVGCYNGLLAFGKKSGSYKLKSAHLCEDRVELEQELQKVVLPTNFKIVLSGLGRVGKGAIEILSLLKIKQVDAVDFLEKQFDEAVFTQLNVTDYNARNDGNTFSRQDFYSDPSDYHSTFPRFLEAADLDLACHYWDARSPFLFTRDDLKKPTLKTQIIADISCDIDGPVASTLRPSTIADPLYGYETSTESETDFYNQQAIGVMAVDNLPCELPKDASEDFGNELMTKILPELIKGDPNGVIKRARMTENGQLTETYSYLQDYVDGVN